MSGAPAGLAPPIGAGRRRPVRVVGISGSLRRGSLNTALLRAAVADAPDWVELEIVSIGDLPLYNADLEPDLPAAVVRPRAAVAAADAILLATPEYNYSIPGTLKNAVDWISRPRRDATVDGKPVAMMGAGG
jgi:chromate reductase, NAD(P)H dehydrogenase (quinone)